MSKLHSLPSPRSLEYFLMSPLLVTRTLTVKRFMYGFSSISVLNRTPLSLRAIGPPLLT